jgi:DNA-directed RNA polymerase subunit RPC12/RpoP
MTQAIAERDEARAKAGAMEARIAELEKEIAVFEKEQEAVAFRKSQADKCYHPDELVIGTEDGYICCHCWAEQAEAKLAEMMDKFRPENFIHHQATECGKCGIRKHTPWRDDTFGYVCATCLSEIHEADLTAARASALEYAAQVERMREALAGIIHWHGCTYSELAPLRSEEMGRARDSARSALSTPAATALIEFAEKVWKAGVMALRPYTSPSHLDAAWLSSPTYLALTKTGKEGV